MRKTSVSDTQNIVDCYVSFWVTAISGKGGSQYDPNPNEHSFFFVPDTYMESCAATLCVSFSPHFDSKNGSLTTII